MGSIFATSDWRKITLATSALVVAGSAVADVFYMDFPVKLNGAEITQLSAGLDGFSLHSLPANEINTKLKNYLSTPVLTWLAQQGNQPLTPEQLQAKGITFKLLAQDMLLVLELKEAAMATDKLSYGRSKHVVIPDHVSEWAWLNNFNLNHGRSNNNENHETRFEWLMSGNWGGGDGIQFNGATYWDKSDSRASEAYRGDWQLFYDQPEKPRRIVFGDIQNRVIGHQSSYPMGGLSIEKAWSRLQPQRNVTPGNSQVFVLQRHASIEIFVNGFLLSRTQLRPGRYDINDLPLTSGSNNIKILATFEDGKTQEFDFTTHYNAQLLAAGLSDYSLTLGLPSSIDNHVYHYDEEVMVTGLYQYGLSDNLTLGFNGATRSDAFIAGVTSAMGFSWGNISLRYSVSHGEENDGEALSVDSEHSVWGQAKYGSPNLRLSLQSRHDFATTPWQLAPHQINEKRFNVDYSFYFNQYWDANLYTSVLLDEFEQRRNEYAARINYRDQGLNVSFGYSYDSQLNPFAVNQNRFFLNVTWSLFNSKNKTREQLRYNSRSETLSASHTKVNHNYMGDHGYQLTAERGSDFRREQLRASYTGRLVRADVNVDNNTRDKQHARANASLNLSTSVGFAGGHVGIGTNVSAPFAVVTKHPSLKKAQVLVNVNREHKAQTQTGDSVGALFNLGTGYTRSQFNIDVPDAPFGYDLGPGTYRVAGGANTGHHFQVGSAMSYTVLGVILDQQNQPISLKRGTVMLPGHDYSKTIFTNRAGRFVVEGIGAGEFILEIDGSQGQFTVIEGEQRFIDVGDVSLKPNKEDDSHD